ncbi:MAG: MFS transporter [Planctomycetes bacterium]|nr:MFS transporter [Planctomycetota bacterium]
MKFYGVSYLSKTEYSLEDKPWIIQLVGALMTLGPFVVYILSGPLASAMRKNRLMMMTCILTAIIAAIGAFNSWAGSMWLYLILIGMTTGVFSAGKMAAVPLEAMRNSWETDKMNGLVSILFIIGMLVGIPAGTLAWGRLESLGVYFGIGAFLLAGLAAFWCHFPNENLKSFKQSRRLLTEETLMLFFRYPLFLLSSPVIWGVAGVMSLAVTSYAEVMSMGSTVMCSLMPLFAAVGVILGNLISMKCVKYRWQASFISCLAMTLIIAFFPLLIQTADAYVSKSVLYVLTASLLTLDALFFGCCTNLIDSEFLKKAAQEKKEGTGAALQSALLALSSFVIGSLMGSIILLGWLDASTQFLLLALLSLFPLFVTLLLAIQHGALKGPVCNVMVVLMKAALALRYRIRYIGGRPLQAKGQLVIPNHPAEMDPVIISLMLWKTHKLRPVIDESFYHLPVVNSVMKLIGAFPMPDLSQGFGSSSMRRLEKTLQDISEALEQGDNVLFYPAGKLARSAKEELGAASGLHYLLNHTENIQLLPLRSRGLWGSSFSTAYSQGRTPDLVPTAKNAFLACIKNAIFFMPRRDVSLEVLNLQDDFPYKAGVMELNQTLQNLYNDDGGDELKHVSYGRGDVMSQEQVVDEVNENPDEELLTQMSKESIEEVLVSLAAFLQIEKQKLTLGTSLIDDLGMDSIARSELILWLENEYGATEVEMNALVKVSDVIKYTLDGVSERVSQEDGAEGAKTLWPSEDRPQVSLPEAGTLIEAFLKSCDSLNQQSMMADDLSGVLSAKKSKMAAIALSYAIRKIPGEHVAIMLPASTAANMVLMACYLARKVPVMLNWTVGPKNIHHALNTSGAKHILTSGAFVDKLTNVDLSEIQNQFIFLEDLKKNDIGLGEKISAWLTADKNAHEIMEQFQLNTIEPHHSAVVLFTSGSESAPKGVPLSHENILSVLKGALQALPLKSEDVLYGFLPPFHSFGFTVTGMLPLLTGLRVAYHPNPTEVSKLVRGTAKWGVSIMCGTPTFIRGILKSSRGNELESLRIVVSGAEKAPAELYEDMSKRGISLLEGYGITECSPVLCLNRPNEEAQGVGKPIAGVTLRIVDPESHVELPLGERGLILAKGPNIFSGYVQKNINPFLAIDEEKWYNTGDLGYLEDSGALVLSGRMKRFVKIAGEMVSLPALEDCLQKAVSKGDEGALLAIQALERDNERTQLYLFANFPMTLEEANGALKQGGFSNLCRLKDVTQLKELPLLGTGKIDYQSLKKDLESRLVASEVGV